jgi:membrane protease YdiL (CAAX protease family)
MTTADTTTQNTSTRLPWWVAALVIPIGFVAYCLGVVAVSKALGWRQYNYDTETAQMMVAGIAWSAVALVILLGIWRWSRWPIQGPNVRWNSAVWGTLAVYLGLGVLTFITASKGGGTPDWQLLAGVFVASMLIGLNEEIAFRGFGLNGFARKLPVFWAVAAQAALFGVCHVTNLFSGSAPGQVALQVVFTFGGGLLFGWLYVFSGRNLWLVAVVHAAHDFFVVAPTTYSGASDDAATALDSIMAWGHSTLGGIVSATIPLVLTYYGWQKYKGQSLEQALGLAPAPEPANA